MNFKEQDYIIVNLGQGNFIVKVLEITINPVSRDGNTLDGLRMCDPNPQGIFLKEPIKESYDLNEGYFSLFWRPDIVHGTIPSFPLKVES